MATRRKDVETEEDEDESEKQILGSQRCISKVLKHKLQ
jgi:hypothetical protein